MNATSRAQGLYLSTVPEPRRVSRSMPRTREKSRDRTGHNNRARVQRTLAQAARRQTCVGSRLPDPNPLSRHGSGGGRSHHSDSRAPGFAPGMEQLAVGLQALSLSENSERTALSPHIFSWEGVGGQLSKTDFGDDRRAGKFARPRKSTRGKVDARQRRSCKVL
jgi:hypothetical protein